MWLSQLEKQERRVRAPSLLPQQPALKKLQGFSRATTGVRAPSLLTSGLRNLLVAGPLYDSSSSSLLRFVFLLELDLSTASQFTSTRHSHPFACATEAGPLHTRRPSCRLHSFYPLPQRASSIHLDTRPVAHTNWCRCRPLAIPPRRQSTRSAAAIAFEIEVDLACLLVLRNSHDQPGTPVALRRLLHHQPCIRLTSIPLCHLHSNDRWHRRRSYSTKTPNRVCLRTRSSPCSK